MRPGTESDGRRDIPAPLPPGARSALIERTARLYPGPRAASRHQVRWKLRADPVYMHLLGSGLLDRPGPFVDLGCGRGILLALITTADPAWSRGGRTLHGIDRSARLIEIARRALPDGVRLEAADLTTATVPACSTAVLLDVLHYLGGEEQAGLLRRVTAALRPGGLLIIREADAGAGLGHLATRAAERTCALARGEWGQRFHYRSSSGWTRLLAGCGFDAAIRPMGDGTPFSNVLIEARRASSG